MLGYVLVSSITSGKLQVGCQGKNSGVPMKTMGCLGRPSKKQISLFYLRKPGPLCQVRDHCSTLLNKEFLNPKHEFRYSDFEFCHSYLSQSCPLGLSQSRALSTRILLTIVGVAIDSEPLLFYYPAWIIISFRLNFVAK